MDGRPDGLAPQVTTEDAGGPATPAADSAVADSGVSEVEWPLDTPWRRAAAHLHLFFVDHGFFRVAYLNLHTVSPGLFRSAQPNPRQIRRLARRGLKTVVNLRGGREVAAFALEREACAQSGVAFEELRLRSRATPTLETIEAAKALLERIEYPALVHCKSGADRAGLMSALALLLRERADVDTARRALGLRYGHVRQGPTGVLDAFLDAYAEADAATPGGLDFMEWARTRYEPHVVAREFKASSWGSWLVDRLLRRE